MGCIGSSVGPAALEKTSAENRMTSTQDAAHEFGALNTLLLVVVLGLCILAAYLIKQNSFYYLPESAAAILVGLVVGGLARYLGMRSYCFLTAFPTNSNRLHSHIQGSVPIS